MKKIILATLIIAAFVTSCKADGKQSSAKGSATDPSYAFGIAIGKSLKETSVAIDYNAFLKGVKDVMEGKKLAITDEEAQTIIRESIEAAMAKKGEENLAKEKAFFEENGKKSGVVTTASGLQYETLKEGTGANPVATDTVKVDYVGTLVDGTKFDSSIDRGEPAVFPLDRVIPGWTEGIQLMKAGGKAKFYIPSTLAYGADGAGDKIGPNATLVFEVDLLEINPKQ